MVRLRELITEQSMGTKCLLLTPNNILLIYDINMAAKMSSVEAMAAGISLNLNLCLIAFYSSFPASLYSVSNNRNLSL